MLLIVADHAFLHGGFTFPNNTITINRLWLQLMIMGGNIGNDIFVLLSGYFLINSSEINYHRLFKFWLKIFFYSIAIYCLLALSGLATFSLRSLFFAARPVTKFTWWFASTYFITYLIHPYINTMIKALSRKDCTKFVKTLVILWCIVPVLGKTSFGANSTINFICVYCIAAYIRLYAPDFKGRKYIWPGLLCILMNFLSIIALDFVNMKANIVSSYYFTGMMGPFTILGCVCLFAGFRGLDIPHSEIINLIASATFGVYLIHENRFVNHFLRYTVFKNAAFQDSPYLIPYSIAVILTVYISCTVIELIRAKIFRTISGGRLS